MKKLYVLYEGDQEWNSVPFVPLRLDNCLLFLPAKSKQQNSITVSSGSNTAQGFSQDNGYIQNALQTYFCSYNDNSLGFFFPKMCESENAIIVYFDKTLIVLEGLFGLV